VGINIPKRSVTDHSSEHRNRRRKRVLLGGVIADPESQQGLDCTIRDISAGGAQVDVKKELSLGGDMYFLDLRNHVAHVAKVAWNRSNRSGLSFIRSYELDAPLPPQMTFLKRLFLEATLRQVQKLIKCGISSEEAAALVG